MSCGTILVVDDKSDNISIITSVLENDYTIVGASNGDLALTIARTQPIDLILLDLMMPGKDGYEVCRELKTDNSTRDIPVIVITGSDLPNAEIDVIEIGAVVYLTKPIMPLLLRAHVRTHLALSEAYKKLAIQNKQLVEAAKLRDDVEQITKHDLKSPLNAIIVAPQLLLMDDGVTERQKKLINQIKDAGYHMLEMINASLDIYRMENGTYQYSPIPIDIVKILRAAWGELACDALKKKLRFCISDDGRQGIGCPPVLVMAEGLLCHSMLSNLLKNAIEASPLDEIITCRVERNVDVDVVIENCGEVPNEIRNSFFDKLVTSGKHNGTGLGTYSAMLIARTQNGHITLDTSVADRTSVRVTLPSCVDKTITQNRSIDLNTHAPKASGDIGAA